LLSRGIIDLSTGDQPIASEHGHTLLISAGVLLLSSGVGTNVFREF
jgi:hypothetical protein